MLRFQRDSRVSAVEIGQPDTLLDREEPLAILDLLRASVQFEPGLTAGGLLRCLSPWSDILSRLGWISLEAWTSRAAKAHLRLAQAPTEDPEAIDALVIRPVVGRHPRRRQPDVLSVHWSVFGRFAKPVLYPGFSKPEHFGSISLLPIEEWINLPVLLVEEAAFPGEDGTVCIESSLYDTIILGFLDEISASGDPDDVSHIRQTILKAVDEIKGDG